MLEGNRPIEKREAKEYPPLPEEVYQVELLDITSEEQKKYKSEELETVMKFHFVLLEGKEGKESLRGRRIWRNFVPVFLYEGRNGKNLLYQIVEALIKKELTRKQEATLDFDKLNLLIGFQCRVLVKNTKKDDKVYSNIESFLPASKKLKGLTDKEKEEAMPKDQDDAREGIAGEKGVSPYEKSNKDKTETNEDVEEIKIEDIPW